jgi:hypothetical protein
VWVSLHAAPEPRPKSARLSSPAPSSIPASPMCSGRCGRGLGCKEHEPRASSSSSSCSLPPLPRRIQSCIVQLASSPTVEYL